MKILSDTRITFNDFLDSYLGRSLSDDVVDISLTNLKITSDPILNSVYSFC